MKTLLPKIFDFKILNKTKNRPTKLMRPPNNILLNIKSFYEITNTEQSRIQGGSRGSNLFRTMRDYQIYLKKKAQNKQTTIL